MPAKKTVKKSKSKKSKTVKKDKELNKEKVKKNHKTKKILSWLIFILIGVLIISLISLSVENGLIENPLNKFTQQPKTFEIKDECSLIVGQLIHTIPDEELCETRCKATCISEEAKFQKVEFIENPSNCNGCTCYCG